MLKCWITIRCNTLWEAIRQVQIARKEQPNVIATEYIKDA